TSLSLLPVNSRLPSGVAEAQVTASGCGRVRVGTGGTAQTLSRPSAPPVSSVGWAGLKATALTGPAGGGGWAVTLPSATVPRNRRLSAVPPASVAALAARATETTAAFGPAKGRTCCGLASGAMRTFLSALAVTIVLPSADRVTAVTASPCAGSGFGAAGGS